MGHTGESVKKNKSSRANTMVTSPVCTVSLMMRLIVTFERACPVFRADCPCSTSAAKPSGGRNKH